MEIIYFNDVKCLVELKKQYKKLAFINHPDRGGETAVMQKINSEYDFLLKNIINSESNDKYSESATWNTKEAHTEAEQRMKAALDQLINLAGLEIEIVGTWLYISGETQIHKEALKAAGCLWNRKRMQWLFVGSKSRGRGSMSMEDIRTKHGSQFVKASSSRNRLIN